MPTPSDNTSSAFTTSTPSGSQSSAVFSATHIRTLNFSISPKSQVLLKNKFAMIFVIFLIFVSFQSFISFFRVSKKYYYQFGKYCRKLESMLKLIIFFWGGGIDF